MPTIKEIRDQYPDYKDLSDQQLADALYKEHYSDVPRDDYDKALALTNKPPADTSVGAYGKVGLASLGKGVTDIGGLIGSGLSALPGAALGRDAEYTFDKTGVKEPEPLSPGFLTEKTGQAIGGWPATDTPGKQILDMSGRGIAPTFIGGAPAAITSAGKALAPLVYGALPGGAAEYVRQQTEGKKFYDWVPGVGGKDMSPYASALTAMLAPTGVQKAVTARKTFDPIRQRQYETAVRESGGTFTPTAGQLTGDPKQINEEWASRGAAINTQQQDSVMQTATQATGAPTNHITYGEPGTWVPQNMARTGNAIDKLEQSTHIQHPIGNTTLPGGSTAFAYPEFANIAMSRPQDVPGILKVIEDTTRLKPTRGAVPGEEIHNALFNSIGTGRLTGEQYKQLRSNLHSAAEKASNPQEAHSYRQTANALDGAMAQTNPGWAQSWNQARREWAHTKVFDNLAAKAKGARTQFTPDEIAAAHKDLMGKEPWTKGELENAPFVSSAQAFKPLKKTEVPESYPAYMKIPILGPFAGHAMNWAPTIAGPGLAGAMYAAGIPGGEAVTAGILGGMTALSPKLASKIPPIVNPTSHVSQWRQKNQLLPPAQTYSPAMMRALFDSSLFKNQPRNDQ